ncbi:MAG: amidase [Alteromonadaceae bacterium]|nr:MAG: amidase [Alteromonadaceae bacterium]
MASFSEYTQYDALGLAALIKAKQVSPDEVLKAAIERIDKLNPQYNAVVNTCYDLAREAIQAGLPNGPLHGVPFLLKDIGATCKGLPITAGSRFIGKITPDSDWAYTARLKQAGALILGTTNTCEFGIGVTTEPQSNGTTYNPWNAKRTPGGSSGGSAVAVATGMSPAAYGGDAFGSIRSPASCCGVVGLKPSRGLNSHGPDVGELMSGIVVIGTLTRSVRDQAALLDITSGFCPGDAYPQAQQTLQVLSFSETIQQAPKPLHIALCADLGNGTQVDKSCITAIEKAAKLCENLGHQVEIASPKLDLALVQQTFRTFVCADTYAALLEHPITGKAAEQHEVEKITWATAKIGEKISAADLIQAANARHAITRTLEVFHQQYDVVITPTLASAPVNLGWLDMMMEDVDTYWKRTSEFAPFCVPFNHSGQPAMSLPMYQDKDGLPIGVQLSSGIGKDALLLQLSQQLEQAQAWQHPHTT